MAKRPKILMPFTVPSGGWNLELTLSVSGTLDTPATATITAGEYFIAWDSQSDDLLHEVTKQIRAAVSAAGIGAGRGVTTYIDSNRRVNIAFVGAGWDEDVNAWDNDVEINWSTSHADLVKALGADSGDDFSSTGTDEPVWTAPRQHAYGWYATEDGQLGEAGKPRADLGELTATQSRALDGSVKTIQWAHRFNSSVELSWLTAQQTWSDGRGYGDVPLAPLPYNQALECWWEEARQGTRFRVYEHDPLTYGVGSSAAQEIGTNDTTSTSLLRDSGKAWGTDPQRWLGMMVEFNRTAPSASRTFPQRFYVSSNTATDLVSDETVATGFSGWSQASDTFYVHDGRYGTYVLDVNEMTRFEPSEIPALDRYNITLPLLRYVA